MGLNIPFSFLLLLLYMVFWIFYSCQKYTDLEFTHRLNKNKFSSKSTLSLLYFWCRVNPKGYENTNRYFLFINIRSILRFYCTLTPAKKQKSLTFDPWFTKTAYMIVVWSWDFVKIYVCLISSRVRDEKTTKSIIWTW